MTRGKWTSTWELCVRYFTIRPLTPTNSNN